MVEQPDDVKKSGRNLFRNPNNLLSAQGQVVQQPCMRYGTVSKVDGSCLAIAPMGSLIHGM